MKHLKHFIFEIKFDGWLDNIEIEAKDEQEAFNKFFDKYGSGWLVLSVKEK